MENNIGSDEARAALSFLAEDGAHLADRVVTPWWYHPILAAIVAAIAVTQTLPGSLGSVLLVITLTDSSPWWALIPAASAGLATLVLGRRYDAVLRQELALPAGRRR